LSVRRGGINRRDAEAQLKNTVKELKPCLCVSAVK